MNIGEIVREIEFVPEIVTVPTDAPHPAETEPVLEPVGPGTPDGG